MSKRKRETMSALPDEIWMQILEMGVENSKLNYKDLCCVAISCKRLQRLSDENTLWSNLVTLDFPKLNLNIHHHPDHNSSSSKPLQSPHYKALYKTKFEKEKERKFAAARRAVLRIESEVCAHSRNMKQIQSRLMEESERMNSTSAELFNLERARRASVALNVWQPDIVRDGQQQIVKQCAVPAESRIAALEMELRLCKKLIRGFDTAYKYEQQRIDAAKEKLKLMKYHPLRDYKLTEREVSKCNIQRKKLKRQRESSTCK